MIRYIMYYMHSDKYIFDNISTQSNRDGKQYLLRRSVDTVPRLDNPDLSMVATISKSYNPHSPTNNFYIVV
jgi:hypothetical protein